MQPLHPTPFGIDAYLTLLQQWLDAAFPRDREGARSSLNSTWLMMARTLCGSRKDKLHEFSAELGQLGLEGRLGDPPIRALESRLRELANEGLHEGFLAVALRDATAELVMKDHPSEWQHWVRLADRIVPDGMRFGIKGDKPTSSRVEYGPDV